MKKKALCIFILVFWLVGACTFLSIKVEEQMIPLVTKTVPYDAMTSSPKLPLDCLQMDEYGGRLYTLYEGAGWEASMRAREAYDSFELKEDCIVLANGWGDYIQYTSKPLQSGQLVNVVRPSSDEEGRWLAVFPEGRPEKLELPDGVEVEEENDHVVQLKVKKDPQPFMEAQAKSAIPALSSAKVYSFADMEKLLDNFTGFGLLLMVLSATVTLWAFSCFLSKDARRNRWYLTVNLAIGLALLACVPLILSTISLPSSLLPQRQITDLGYFASEMDQFFGGLKSFAPAASSSGALAANLPKSEAGIEIINRLNTVAVRPLLYFAGGILFAGLAALAERVIIYYKRRPRIL